MLSLGMLSTISGYVFEGFMAGGIAAWASPWPGANPAARRGAGRSGQAIARHWGSSEFAIFFASILDS